MTAEPLTCPYCNAQVPLPDGAQDGQRIQCRRCGETFPLRGVTGAIKLPPGIATAPMPGVSAALVQPSLTNPRRPANRLLGGAVLGVMILMAAGGLTFALMTQAQRRANDTGAPPRIKRPLYELPDGGAVPLAVAPAKLDTLGYLPPHTNLVLCVQVAALQQTAAGRKILAEPIALGQREIVLERLFGWTGLKIDELDHLLVGIRTEDVDFPRIVIVARTVKPLNLRDVRSRLRRCGTPGARESEEHVSVSSHESEIDAHLPGCRLRGRSSSI